MDIKLIAILLSVEVLRRNALGVEQIISAVSRNMSDKEVAKKIFQPVLLMFSLEDREWFDCTRKNASWNVD